MKGVSQAVSAILLILIAASSAVLLEMFLSSHVSEAMGKTQTTPPLAPPTIQTVYQRDGKICVLIANPNNSDLNLVGRKLMVSREGEVLALTELNVVIPPRDFNVVCKEVSIPESGEYTITILTSPYPASATATLQKIRRPNLAVVSLTYSPQVIYEGNTVTFEANICNNGDGDAAEFFVEFNIDSSEIDVVSVPSLTAGACTTVSTSWDATTHGSYTITALADYNDMVYESDESDNSESNTFTVAPPFEVVLSHGLTFSPSDSNRYDNVLFHGDYNRVYITIQGPPGTYTISSPCLEQVSCTIGGGETNCTVETNTTDANFSCEVTVSGPASTEMNVPVWYYLECNTCQSCTDAFNDANSYLSSHDTNALIHLTSNPISHAPYCIRISNIHPSTGKFIVLDGDTHMIEVACTTTETLLEISSSSNIRISYIKGKITYWGSYRAICDAFRLTSSYNIGFDHVYVSASGLSSDPETGVDGLHLQDSSNITLADSTITVDSNTDKSDVLQLIRSSLIIDVSRSSTYLCAKRDAHLILNSSSTISCRGCESGNKLYWYDASTTTISWCYCAEKLTDPDQCP